MIAVEHDVVGDAEARAGVGIQCGGRGHFEGIRLNRSCAERVRQHSAGCHVDERGIRSPVGRALVVDDIDVAGGADDGGEARRIDRDVHRRVDVKRAHVFEERVLREGIAGEFRFVIAAAADSGNNRLKATNLTLSPKRCVFIIVPPHVECSYPKDGCC